MMGGGEKGHKRWLNRKLFILVGGVFCALSLFANEPIDPPSLSYFLGVNSGSAMVLDFNPAALARAKGSSVGCSIENHYAVNEWNEAGISGIWGHKKDGLRFDFRQKGPSFYREHELGLAYGRSLGSSLQAGLKLKYHLTSIPDDKIRSSTISFDVGFRARFGKKMVFSVLVRDPVNFHAAKSKTIPASVALGILYEPDQRWVLSLELLKPPEFRPSFVFGIGLRPSPLSTAWIKLFSNPWKLEMGWGITWGKIQLYSFANYHAVLGISPGIAIFRTF